MKGILTQPPQKLTAEEIDALETEAVWISDSILQNLDPGGIAQAMTFQQIAERLEKNARLADFVVVELTELLAEAKREGRADIYPEIKADQEHIERALKVLDELKDSPPDQQRERKEVQGNHFGSGG